MSFCIPGPYYLKVLSCQEFTGSKNSCFPRVVGIEVTSVTVVFKSFGSLEEWGNQEKLCGMWVVQQALNCRSKVPSPIFTSVESYSLHCRSVMHHLIWLFRKNSNYSKYSVTSVCSEENCKACIRFTHLAELRGSNPPFIFSWLCCYLRYTWINTKTFWVLQ